MKVYILASLLAFAGLAQAHDDDRVYAEITNVTPVYDYQTEYTEHTICKEHRSHNSVIGAIIGGAVGHQFGNGDGRTASTIAGAVIGGAIGNERDHDNRHDRCYTESYPVTREVLRGYNVEYYYHEHYGTTFSYERPRDNYILID